MINNRQAGRRNRGRNNGRQNGGNRGGDNGNRIDNRARGNAPQLLEKYRNLARDAQLAGDRVNTEYYLQFADHYFRVIADNRARQEEQQARYRRNDDNRDDAMQGDDVADLNETMIGDGSSNGAADMADNGGVDDNDRRPSGYAVRQPRGRGSSSSDADAAEAQQGEEQDGRRRPRRAEKIVVNRRNEDEGEDTQAASDGENDSDDGVKEAAPRRAARGRKPRQAVSDGGADDAPGLDLAALPPAIARSSDGEAEEKPAPKRRGRRPKAEAEAAE